MAAQVLTTNHNANYTGKNTTKLGIQIQKPKYPHYAVFAKRLESFKKWQSNLGIKPEILAEAGLVFTGIGDAVRCYHCGGGLRNWESGDDPWFEHAKWYPECPHIILVKGQSFINKVKGNDVEQDCPKVSEESETVEDVMETPAALSCIEMGYNRSLVQRAIKKYIDDKRHSYFKGMEIAELCEELESCDISNSAVSNNVTDCVQTNSVSRSDSVYSTCSNNENLDDLLEENQRLKDNFACKICLEDRATVIFVNCGHMVACPQCAPALSRCPMCRDPVEGYVKAVFA